MPKRLVALLIALLAGSVVVAQHPDDDYYPYAEYERPQPLPEPDTALFYRAVQQNGDRYAAATTFVLPQVTLRRRGTGYADERFMLGDLTIDRRYAAPLRSVGGREELSSGIRTEQYPADGLPLRRFRLSAPQPERPRRLSVGFGGHNYLAGIRASARFRTDEWRLTAAVEGRMGRDLFVEGVFTEALTATLHAATGDDERTTELLVAIPLSCRGTRLSSSPEAFSLTGDRLYNPAWGLQRGRVRNSRVRREAMPLAAGSRGVRLSPSTRMRISAALEAGREGYSALGWYDAPTPMPDNYRYLPSYTGDRAAEQAWRTADSRYTQIGWDALIRRNRLAGGEAHYALEERVGRRWHAQTTLCFETEPTRGLLLRYGVRLALLDARNYLRMRDLLGADHLVDIDHYLVDDDSYASRRQNDLRHPDRRIRRGDRFGYDYSLRTEEARLWLLGEYRADRLTARFSASAERTTIRRRGHYEKELFPEAGSYGPSRRLRFTPYSLSAEAGWAFSPRLFAGVAGEAAARAPEAEALFVQPLYNNLPIDSPRPVRSYAAELVFRMTGPVAELYAAAFLAATLDAATSRRYYDDLAGLYCDMQTAGIGRGALGIEATAALRPARRWRITLAASAGRYRYIRDPRLTIRSDRDGSAVDLDARSRMGCCRTGLAPALTATGEIAWYGPRGWSAKLAAGWAAGRYAEPEPLRRTDRVAGAAGVTPEAFEAFTRQERLPDAFTLDATLLRSFRVGGSRLLAILSLRNLTGRYDTAAAYESSRIRRMQAGAATLWQPHPSRLLYAWPRTLRVSVVWDF